MGFLTKACSICGASLFALGGYSLKDGCYCKRCKTQLSPFFIHEKVLTVDSIRDQLAKRAKNEQLFAQLISTKTIGNYPKLLIDENSGQFAVLLTPQKNGNPTPDVISFSQLADCSIEIKEKKTEVKYKDYNDNLKSFAPPYYAYSFDFFVNISVNIPYIRTIRIKINEEPVDNDQPHIIEKTGGLGQMFRDALGSARSFNGLTSNISEVQSSSAYRKYDSIANEMRNALMEVKANSHRNNATLRCPWCDSLVINNSSGICEHCCGPL
jgi:hypothetical protein